LRSILEVKTRISAVKQRKKLRMIVIMAQLQRWKHFIQTLFQHGGTNEKKHHKQVYYAMLTWRWKVFQSVLKVLNQYLTFWPNSRYEKLLVLCILSSIIRIYFLFSYFPANILHNFIDIKNKIYTEIFMCVILGSSNNRNHIICFRETLPKPVIKQAGDRHSFESVKSQCVFTIPWILTAS
jgi:hypothetical protein